MLIRIRTFKASAAAAIALAAPAALAEVGASLNVGVGHTDNATLVDSGKTSDTLPSIGGALEYTHESRRINASFNGQGNYVHYVDDTFDDDFLGSASGSLLVGIVPERFLWSFEDTYGQIAVNQFEPVTPENRQSLNSFSTGPDLILRLGGQSEMQLSGRYGDARYEESDQINTQNLQGSLSFRRNVSRTSFWGVVASSTRTEYDAPGDPEYDSRSLYATWQSTGARQRLSVDVGATEVEQGDDSFSSPLIRVGWNRQLAPSWTLDLDLGSEYQNTAEQFVSNSRRALPEETAVGVSQDPAASHHAGLSFSFERPRTEFRVGSGFTQLDYEANNALDEDSWYLNGEFSRRLTPSLQGFLDYRLEERNPDANATQKYTRQVAGVRVDLRIGRALFLTGGYRYTDSDSDSTINRYTSNFSYLALSYRYGTVTRAPNFAY